jgi:porin
MSCPRVSPIVVVICLLGLWTTSIVAQEPAGVDDQAPRFGGPNAVENQLHDDRAVDRPTFFEKYFAWKDELTEKHGFSFGIDYSAAWLGADSSPSEDRAAGGMLRFFGSWDLVGRNTKNTGAFVWKVEHRHGYTDVAPSGFGFNLGYVGLFEPPFSDQGLRWTNFFWRQRWKEGKVTVLAGFLDATDYVDVYSLASPWTGFLNFAFSTGSQTIPVPNDAALGVAAGAMLTDNLFLIGGLVDSNADPAEFWQGFDTFFNDNEYFKSVEIGWTASQDRIYLDNVHLTLWHADERVEGATPSGWGANISWTKHVGGRWLPFVRAGWADDGGTLMQKSVSVGFGYQKNPGKNLLGLGLNWGEPNESTWEPGLPNQYTAELFYRWQVSKAIAITPDVEYLINPALNPDTDSIWVFGLRVRGAF